MKPTVVVLISTPEYIATAAEQKMTVMNVMTGILETRILYTCSYLKVVVRVVRVVRVRGMRWVGKEGGGGRVVGVGRAHVRSRWQ